MLDKDLNDNTGSSLQDTSATGQDNGVSEPTHPDVAERRNGDIQIVPSHRHVESSKENVDVEKCHGLTGKTDESAGSAYCVLSERRKISMLLLASFAAIISPISGSIYFPAIQSLSRDLNTSVSLIDVTISTYLIFQGIAPSFTASFAETYGRRPAYFVCFAIYLGANIGLALQTNYAALLVLRCLQSAGSSGTIAIGSAVAADMSTRAQRGKYIGYSALGVTLGPALGPVIGGLLDHFLGWRAIFWFLAILTGVFAVTTGIFLQETCRAIVGNGSVPPPRWMRSGLQIIEEKWSTKAQPSPDPETLQPRKRRLNPLYSVRILMDIETFLILVYGAMLYAGYMSVLSVLSPELAERYNFNSIQVGLCYLPIGVGSLSSRWTVGRLLDWNFRREAKRQGLELVQNRQQEISNFNIERARLSVTIPILAGACLFVLAYGWLLEFHTALPAQLVILFFVGLLTTGSFSSLNTLNIDINRTTPALASASSNLMRCLLGAGAVAAFKPLINSIGIGWTSTIVAAIWLLSSMCIWWVYARGYSWRVQRAERSKRNNHSG